MISTKVPAVRVMGTIALRVPLRTKHIPYFPTYETLWFPP
jgi:hypothetical protein